jgi:hypothetical protein
VSHCADFDHGKDEPGLHAHVEPVAEVGAVKLSGTPTSPFSPRILIVRSSV